MKKVLLVLAMVFVGIVGNAQSNEKMINGHEYVDLGLSVKWADRNYAAKSAEEYGAYMTYEKALSACKYWGETWRLPTKDEMIELVDFCSWTWTTQNGKNGYQVTGPNGNSIFIPAAGYRDETGVCDAEETGYYWGATLNETDIEYAWGIYFISRGYRLNDHDCYDVLSVRFVTE